MQILATGGTGTLGTELKKVFNKAFFPEKNEMDITNLKKVNLYISKIKPGIIIHAAAKTGIRECEDDKLEAYKVNVEGTKNLIEASFKLKPDPYFIYISTACVFSGDNGPYDEEDLPYPKNYYSLTKLLGEYIVRESKLKRWLIIRCNFVAKKPWIYPKAFKDRFGTYLFADDVAKEIKNLITKKVTGIVHLCGKERMSMYKLAKMVTPKIKSVTLKDYKGPPLTRDMSLTSLRIKAGNISNPSQK